MCREGRFRRFFLVCFSGKPMSIGSLVTVGVGGGLGV